MRGKRFLAGLLTVAMIGASLATPGNTLQAEAAAKPLKKISIAKKATVYVGAKKQLKVTKAPKNTTAKITWKSSNKKVATVSSKGAVKGVKAGTATITASAKGEKNKTLKAACKVTVKKRLIQKLKANFTKTTLEVGRTKTIKTTITPKNASIKKLKYNSSDKNVASVSSKGKITAKKAGKATITVSATDGSKKKASIQVTVKAKAVPQVKVSKVSVEGSEFTMEAGSKQKLKVTVAPANATNKKLDYTLSDPYAASVSADGTVTALAQGSTDITVEAADGSGAKAKVHVTVVDTDKPRAVITQDGEVDDQNSMIHLLLYANEIDIQGIVQTSSQFHWIGDPDATYTEEGKDFKNPYRWPGTDWMMEMADDYASVYGNLRTHDAAYPTPDYIRSVIKIGNIAYKGDMRKETDGSKLVEKAFMDDDPRTLYLMAWGGTNTIGRALKSIEEKYKNTNQWAAIRKKIIDKTVIGAYGTQDQTYSEYIGEEWPEIMFVEVSGTSYGYAWSRTAGNVDSEAKRTMSSAWMRENLDYGHGPLLDRYVVWGDGTYLPGEEEGSQFGTNEDLVDSTDWWGGKFIGKYQRYDFLSEGDSPSFFYLMDTGLRSLENKIANGSFAGRYQKRERKNSKGEAQNWYSVAKDYDPLQEKLVSSDWRWMADIQHQFAVRADWCITPKYEDANHTPSLTVKEGLDFTAKPGETLTLHAQAEDPDGDYVAVSWEHYFEADTYQEPEDNKGIYIKGAKSSTATITVPKDAKDGDTLVINVKAEDNGAHALARYQQVIITVSENGVSRPNSITASVKADKLKVGETAQIGITPEPAGTQLPGLAFESSDPKAATVSRDGVITAVSQGKATITVSSAVGNLKASVDVTVDYDGIMGKPRAVITQDAEVDDQNSLIHALLYANEIDFQGIVQTSSKFHWIGDESEEDEASKNPYRWPGTEWMDTFADAYEEVYDNLHVHDPAYPTPNYIRSIIKVGNIGFKGDMKKETDGSKLVEEKLLDDDPRTLHVMAWGGTNTIGRALKSIEEKYKNTNDWAAIRKKIVDKTMIGAFGKQDQTYDEYIAEEWPEIPFMNVGGGTTYGYAWSRTAGDVDSEGKRTLSSAWMRENLDYGHGPLLDKYVTWGDGTYLPGEEEGSQFGTNESMLDSTAWWGRMKYQRYDFLSEGDSPSFFYLMDTGLRSLENPAYGSFAGRYYLDTNTKNSKGQALNWYKTVQDYDPLQKKKVNSDWRWMADIQHQFATRADWCVTPDYEDANHTPSLTVEEGLDFKAAPGQDLMLHAKASDPDGDYVSICWEQYFEADTYTEPEENTGIYIKGAKSDVATITIPEDAKNGDTIIINVKATDNGAHSLSRYQQVIITVEGAAQPQSVNVSGDTAVEAGKRITLAAAVLPETATVKTVSWESSDTSVAAVNESGQVTGVSAGKATITAVSKADKEIKGSIEITVTRAADDPANSKVRTIVTTDGEVDDMDSFMRLMLYANEMDIAGLILSSSTFHYAGDPEKGIAPYRWTGTQWAYDVLDDYAEVYENLKIHADGYPTPAYLKSILKIGNIKNVGEMEEVTEGSEFMKDILLDNDERTLYIQTWGGTNTTARALKSIEEQYKGTSQWDAVYKKVCDKAVIYIILNQDDTFSNYIKVNWPDIKTIHDGGTFWRFAYMWKQVPAGLTTKLSGNWFYKNILKNHGPLLANYKTMGDGTTLEGELDNEQRGWENRIGGTTGYDRYDFISEGDSPSFFYLLDTGLRSLEDPTYGGWGGRFGYGDPDNPGEGTYENNVADHNTITGKDDTAFTLTRWFDDIQNDFGARADWCVADSFEKANHRPTATVATGLDVTAYPGEAVKMDVDASDPDGDSLSYRWWQYYEADTYSGALDGKISMKGASSDKMSFTVPEDAQNGDTIHMVVEVYDDGAHNMKHYQRVIITVAGREELGNLEMRLPEGTAGNTIAFGEPTSGWGGPSYSKYAKQLSILNNGAALPAGKTFTWESSDTAVATVNAAGLVTPAGKAGAVTITASANDGSGKTVSMELTLTDTRTASTAEEGTGDAAEPSEAASPQAGEDAQGDGGTQASKDGKEDAQPEDSGVQEGTQPEGDSVQENIQPEGDSVQEEVQPEGDNVQENIQPEGDSV